MVENAFGILSSRFRILRSPILQNYSNAVKSVKAAVVLHNYIMQNSDQEGKYLDPGSLECEDEAGNILPGHWVQDGLPNNLFNLHRLVGNRSGTQTCREQQDALAKALVTDGLSPWQSRHVFRSK